MYTKVRVSRFWAGDISRACLFPLATTSTASPGNLAVFDGTEIFGTISVEQLAPTRPAWAKINKAH